MENLENWFKKIEGTFDTEEPQEGHQARFLDRLNASKGTIGLYRKNKSWWRPLSIAASILVLMTLGLAVFMSRPTLDEQVAEISPEVSKSQIYFAGLIEEQVNQLKRESTPATKKMIDDTLLQLKKLERNYGQLEQDLLNGGNSKLILSAMITNFQTRIDLLQDVLDQVETINNIKNNKDENIAI
jgi:anti-sigma-K factor RskA